MFVKQIQFHQSYSYEDFLEGLRPNREGGFEATPGIFLDWNESALRDPGNRYVLLIEELSRANVSAVLGELLTYVEYRDRLFETPITRKRVKIARNLTIVATMNPLDRSALELDDALIRRLQIIECPPSVEQLREMLSGKLPPSAVDKLAAVFDECKKRFPGTFAEQMPFGHGLFAGVASEEDLKSLWHHRVKHILQRTPQVPAHPFAKAITEMYPWR